ncbi:hypothetical protein JB92DRAFT_3108286 [Gautieria morchelliformis]|nr:hypothetical protein JB92DRAFT_3108286 [Gautieria morchelliformis]
MQGPPRRSAVPEIIVLDDDTPPEPSTRAVSPGAPSPWSCSDERVELTGCGLLETAVYELPISVEEHTPVPPSDNPSTLPKRRFTPTRLSTSRPSGRQTLSSSRRTPVADVLSGFDRMDVDEQSERMTGGRLPRNVSSESELYGMWYSSESTIASPFSSSAGSSPLCSETELPTSSESAVEAHLDAPSGCAVEIPENVVSLASGASLDPEA